MKQTFYSNGKLLITGEYLVLDGALALALPTKFGQYLHIEPGSGKKIVWTSKDSDGRIWFSDTFSFDDIIDRRKFEKEHTVKDTLIEILHEGFLKNKTFLDDSDGYNITTELTFPKFWGLGTSSTLINNIAQWLQVDAFKLLHDSFGGSGYDIACAQNDTPILYQLETHLPKVSPVTFNPPFKENLYFVYLNQKQNSRAAIASYYDKQQRIGTTIAKINKLTQSIVETAAVSEFATLLETHETIMSDVLEMQTVKERYFHDFPGVVKSLGAWGGDFAIVVSRDNPTAYFKTRGFTTILTYDEMIK